MLANINRRVAKELRLFVIERTGVNTPLNFVAEIELVAASGYFDHTEQPVMASTEEKSAGMEEQRISISAAECVKTIEFIEKCDAKSAELSLGGTSVVQWEGKICHLDQTNAHVRMQADSELIAQITWFDQERTAGMWRWGHTLKLFEDEAAAKIEFTGEWKWMNCAAIDAADIVIDTMIRRCAEEYKYDFVETIRLSKAENEKYVFGLRNIRTCSTDESALSGMDPDILRKLAKAVHDKADGNQLPEGMSLEAVE